MSKFKNALLVLAAASLVTSQAQANEDRAQSLQAKPAVTFSQADIHSMFEQSGPFMQLAALSEVEMKETEGAWWFVPVMAWSLGGGAFGMGVNRWSTGSWSGSGRAFGAGATAGFWSSPLVRPMGSVTTFAAGTLGSASWFRR